MHPRALRCLAGVAALLMAASGLLAAPAPAQTTNSPARQPRFESDIRAFLARDLTNPPPRHAILFIGSSIFRQWTNVVEQMAPLPVFNRAFGGSRTQDLLDRLDSVVLPYEPRVIVYYCGSNDINGGETPEAIAQHFREFVQRVHAKLPATRLIYVSINRAPQKRDRWEQVDRTNALIRDYCASDVRLKFVDVNPALFDAAGEPRTELFQADKLHLRPAAYAGFTALLKPTVNAVWNEVAPSPKAQ